MTPYPTLRLSHFTTPLARRRSFFAFLHPSSFILYPFTTPLARRGSFFAFFHPSSFIPHPFILLSSLLLLLPLTSIAQPARHALLVGCSEYPNLSGKYRRLAGPENDVELFKTVLTSPTFGFPSNNITSLAGWPGNTALRPTYANIVASVDRLINIVKPGDQVVILLSGHGSEQPDVAPQNDEQDGKDETFLPSDIQSWDGQFNTVSNAIVDDEIGRWMDGFENKQAFVWLIVDACHSNTITRGGTSDRWIERFVPPSILGVDPAIRNAYGATRGPSPLRDAARSAPLGIQQYGGHVVTMTAAREDQRTISFQFPNMPRTYGLFTYTLVEMLATKNPRSYRDLIDLVQQRYSRMKNQLQVTFDITPSIEGSAADLPILSSHPNLRLDWLRLGLVRDPELAFADYAPLRFAVQIQKGLDTGEQIPDEIARLLSAPQNAAVQPATRPDNADWLVQIVNNEIHLIPGAGFSPADLGVSYDGTQQTPSEVPDQFNLGDASAPDAHRRVAAALGRIARVNQLLRLAQPSSEQLDAPPPVDLRLEMRRHPVSANAQSNTAIPVSYGPTGRVLHKNDRVSFTLTNTGQKPVDATLLFLDSHYGITSFLPHSQNPTPNRLAPDQQISTPTLNITDLTLGYEYMVALAVEATTPTPVHFNFLEQSPVERVESNRSIDGPSRALPSADKMNNPLMDVLHSAIYGQTRTTRGMTVVGTDNPYVIRSIGWYTAP